ncbi:MAG: GspH/FimT family pseudopilin [Hyphomonadaceae bacterium]|nr:GspH/FimT family pseudopilin [Hyphomonadaceae bacterium]
MPISAIGNKTRAREGEAGFTLVELLVVVFIIALMSTIVVLSLPEGNTPLRGMTQALALKLNQAGRESILTGEPVALAMAGEESFRFERYRDGEWSTEDLRHLALQTRDTASGVSVSIAHQSASLRPVAASTGREGDDTPGDQFHRQVVFSPLGEATPAEIRLQDGAEEAVIRITESGEVSFDILAEGRF